MRVQREGADLSPYPVYLNGKCRGVYYPDRESYLTRRSPEHYCIRYQGWGIQREILAKLISWGARWFVILYSPREGPKEAFQARITDFIDSGITATLNPEDGEQVFLRQDSFKRYIQGQERLAMPLWEP